MINPKRIRFLAALTLFGMGGLGLFLINMHGLSIIDFWSEEGAVFSVKKWAEFVFELFTPQGEVIRFLKGKGSWIEQIAIGLTLGLVVSMLAHFILTRNFIQAVNAHYKQVFRVEQLSWGDILFLSFSAGIGEELLFRGGMQFYFGIWLTALIFVAVHGYLNPKNWQISVYGAFMTVAMAGLGYATIHVGIVSAIIAHAFIDIYLLTWMKSDEEKERKIKEKVNREALEIKIRAQRLVAEDET